MVSNVSNKMFMPQIHFKPIRLVRLMHAKSFGALNPHSGVEWKSRHKFGDYAPFMVFSGAMVIATFCASWLPETANRILPNTVSEAENFEKDWKYFRCTGCPHVHAEVSTHRDLVYHIEEENENPGRRLSPRSTWPALYEMKSDTVIFKKN
ncbi:hypothetical protein TNCV_2862311 [Trichonephila clavipes]|nr:hypothetical protein TNCV_2862311 [Trichonephila clavipes]